MRRYIRHPTNIPIELLADGKSGGEPRLKDVGPGGLCVRTGSPVLPGSRVRVRIPVQRPPFEAEGVVAWCRGIAQGFEVGVRFSGDAVAFALRMVEQICHIEQYRADMRRHQGRVLSSEQAAEEWIGRHASAFPR